MRITFGLWTHFNGSNAFKMTDRALLLYECHFELKLLWFWSTGFMRKNIALFLHQCFLLSINSSWAICEFLFYFTNLVHTPCVSTHLNMFSFTCLFPFWIVTHWQTINCCALFSFEIWYFESTNVQIFLPPTFFLLEIQMDNEFEDRQAVSDMIPSNQQRKKQVSSFLKDIVQFCLHYNYMGFLFLCVSESLIHSHEAI